MRILTSLAAMAAFAVTALAVPALPKPITFIQPDGSEITVLLRGDERAHCYLSEDGYLLVNENDALYYGCVSADGTIARSDLLARKPEARTPADRTFLNTVDMEAVKSALRLTAEKSKFNMRQELISVPAATSAAKAEASHPSYGKGLFPGTHFPAFGNQKGLVVLVQYKDVSFKLDDPYDYFSRMLNEEGFSDYNATGSARDYFVQNSNGQFLPEFDVYGPVTLSKNRSYYGGNDSNGDDKNPELMAVEACQLLDDTVDFSQYDRDGDGMIDNVYIFYAGAGEASGGSSSTVWPHSWNVIYGGHRVILDGVQLANYACSNEWYSGPDGIGTFVHEFSHVMGLPDIYATDYTSAFTPGSWCVMDAGSYNNDSRTPPAYGAYERNAMGWCKPAILSGDEGEYSLNPIAESNEAFLIPTSKANEFFLLENRQKTGWDKHIPGHGMLIWHIDYNESVWNSNEVNNTASHQYVDIEEADGVQSENSRGGDAFPGTSGVRSFTDSTNPGMLTWSGAKLYTPITEIAENNGVITFKIPATEKPAPFSMDEPESDEIGMNSAILSWHEFSGAHHYMLHIVASDNSYNGKYRYGRNVGNKTAVEVSDLAPATDYNAYVVPVTIGASIVFESPSNTISFRTLDDPAGIGDASVDAAVAPAEYYTLQGIRIDADRLTPGIYIMRQGNVTRKVAIK